MGSKLNLKNGEKLAYYYVWRKPKEVIAYLKKYNINVSNSDEAYQEFYNLIKSDLKKHIPEIAKFHPDRKMFENDVTAKTIKTDNTTSSNVSIDFGKVLLNGFLLVGIATGIKYLFD